MEEELKKTKKTLIGCDTIVNSPSSSSNQFTVLTCIRKVNYCLVGFQPNFCGTKKSRWFVIMSRKYVLMMNFCSLLCAASFLVGISDLALTLIFFVIQHRSKFNHWILLI